LAALLRFADELADDITRSDKYAIESEIISKHSEIFHIYSQSLHTVAIEENKQDNEFYLKLIYDFDSKIAKKKFIRENSEIYLIDEIYNRTIKMEKERRYCMRYLRSFFYLSRIKVFIKITNEKYAMDARDINYILEEEGYPEDDIFIKGRISGDELAKSFEPRNNGDKK
jgi:hypothetical protein